MKLLYGSSISDIFSKHREAFLSFLKKDSTIVMGDSIKALYLDHREDFLKAYAEDNYKPVTHAQLVKRHVDSSGKQYYGFPQEMMFPLERHGKLMFYMQHIAKGLTPEEDEKIDDAIAKVLMEEKQPTKINIRIAALLAERERRRKMCFHTELFYNIIAVQLIREDEPVEVFDNDIHLQKVSQFKEEAKKKASTHHFFQVPEFKKLNDMLKLSPEEWEQSWQDSLMNQEQLKEILKVYTSATILTSKEKTSRRS